MTSPSTKPTIGLFTTIEGHRSIAEAIQSILQDEFTVEVYLERDDAFDLYVPFYKFFPAFFTIPFQISKQKQIAQLLGQYFKRKYQRKLRLFFHRHQPKLLISIYFMYNLCLQDLADENAVPFINVLTDPRSFHPMIIAEKAQTNLTFDQKSLELCKGYCAEANVQKIGWFVRPEYEQSYDQKKVREALNLNPDVLTVLIVSGSEGTNVVTTILPALLNSEKPIQVLVACGNSKNLYRSIKAISQRLLGSQEKVMLQPIGFTKQLYLYMQAADLVVGKAGPNTLFEAAATLTPFFAITHIAGQEDGNLDIIREYQLGYVEENIFKAHKLLSKIVRNPEQLQAFQPHLKKMAAYNASAKKEFKQLVHQLLPQSA